MLLLAAILLQKPVTMGGDEVTEASGLVVSATQPGILWTHNDSGDGAYLYAFDTQGKPRATVLVRNAHNYDWEDLATGPFPGKPGTWLYASDTGDNKRVREDVCVYAIPEPKVGPSSKARPLLSADATRLLARYPDGSHNAECLLCDPRDGRLTVVTKEKDGVSGVYRFPEKHGNPYKTGADVLERVGKFQVPGDSPLVTGGSFRPDGGALALVTYTHVIELKGPDFWAATPVVRPQPGLKKLEGVSYSRDGKSLWITSEGEHAPLVRLASAL